MKRLSTIAAALAMALIGHAQGILVEAESFTNHGNWTFDCQFIDQMGSPYLLAHGLGKKVADATTEVKLPAAGKYHVWARTYNWTSPWSATKGAGAFKIAVDGRSLKNTLGNTGTDWEWQYAGEFKAKKENATISLQDLSGFDGRCDAIYISSDKSDVPPSNKEELAAFRKRLNPVTVTDKGTYDLVVVGGGIAGIHTAVAAARLGVKTALIQNRSILGGNNSSEVRVHLGGALGKGRYPKLGATLYEYAPTKKGNAGPAKNFCDDDKLAWVKAEPNISLFLDTHITDVEQDKDGTIKSVKGVETKTGNEVCFSAPLFVDATGDGNLGFLSGADYLIGRESRDEYFEPHAPEKADRMTSGASILWRTRKHDDNKNYPFPKFVYGIELNDSTVIDATISRWFWETGMFEDQLNHAERLRDYGMLAAYSNWSYLKNNLKLYPNLELEWVSFVPGKRETRRLLGDYILKENDMTKRMPHEDASFNCNWSIDVHYPQPKHYESFPDAPFISEARHVYIYPYDVPYRCLYSRNIPNLFMAGRNISCTHMGLGSVRVMRTVAQMGEVVGMAAKVCKDHNTQPRGVYRDHLAELRDLMTKGVARKVSKPHKQNYVIDKYLKD